MDYMSRLGSLGYSSTASGSSDPVGGGRLSYSWPSLLRFFVSAVLLSIYYTILFLPSSSVSSSCCILVLPFGSIRDNRRARVPHFLLSYRMVFVVT